MKRSAPHAAALAGALVVSLATWMGPGSRHMHGTGVLWFRVAAR